LTRVLLPVGLACKSTKFTQLHCPTSYFHAPNKRLETNLHLQTVAQTTIVIVGEWIPATLLIDANDSLSSNAGNVSLLAALQLYRHVVQYHGPSGMLADVWLSGEHVIVVIRVGILDPRSLRVATLPCASSTISPPHPSLFLSSSPPTGSTTSLWHRLWCNYIRW
jgi:hypothetical protein